jgi:hypothetical protein
MVTVDQEKNTGWSLRFRKVPGGNTGVTAERDEGILDHVVPDKIEPTIRIDVNSNYLIGCRTIWCSRIGSDTPGVL